MIGFLSFYGNDMSGNQKEGKFFGAKFVKDKHGNANSACVFDLVILILISKNTKIQYHALASFLMIT